MHIEGENEMIQLHHERPDPDDRRWPWSSSTSSWWPSSSRCSRPFIVLFTIPLAFTGGLLALWITGKELSVIAMLGFLMLAGVVVNNGIVFVDYANQLRLEGMEKREALVQTGRDRIRPILMTAMTTILGLATMALGLGSRRAI